MSTPYNEIITSEEELRELLGYPSEIVQSKAIQQLDAHCRNFISMSPLLFLSTANNQGFCDVSPRGDTPGSVLVLDEQHLVIPERPGNRRIDSLKNILSNPRVGIIFIIPGLEETLRVNGKASIVRDDHILEQLIIHDKKPSLAIGVEVEECFIHCAKAFKRSSLWEPASWIGLEKLPKVSTILKDHINSSKFTEEVIQKGLIESYEKRLY